METKRGGKRDRCLGEESYRNVILVTRALSVPSPSLHFIAYSDFPVYSTAYRIARRPGTLKRMMILGAKS